MYKKNIKQQKAGKENNIILYLKHLKNKETVLKAPTEKSSVHMNETPSEQQLA